ncbi:MAG: GNAT superfamily N-acetyltransferase [Candidatus Azotimanducaceae bacterium]|jgi:GNAT superfamily N-acetyltransferase
MDLRIAKTSDREILEEFISPAYGRTIQDELDDQLFGLQDLVIAWQSNTPRGYGFIHWPGPRELSVADRIPGCPEVFRMTVVPEYQSSGIGTGIIRFFESLAREKGYSSLGLAVAHENIRANKLYQRLGYAQTVADDFVASYQHESQDGSVVTITEKCSYLQKSLLMPN